jgi:2-dehydro-3-deoxyphosphogluconate aldolase / (4S)-4-hydroxy-2-oxoglutarate aldolase
MTGALAAVAAQRVLPVVTIEDAGAAHELGAALQEAGANTVEITFRSDAAAEAIKVFADQGFIVGAGTVRSQEHVEQAAAAGASFAVSPGLDRDIVERCADLGLTPLPGIATPSELTAALALGISTVKLFPAEVVGGAALIRALAAPFPDVRFVPTGGLNAQNARSYLELPEVLAIGGSWMVAPALLSGGRWDDVGRLTREALAL